MKKLFILFGIAACLFIGIQTVQAGNGVGNLAKCKAYSVNVVAYENCPKTDNAQRIAVAAEYNETPNGQTYATVDRKNFIYLFDGSEFRVLASNACDPQTNEVCDNEGACLSLDGSLTWEIWIRLVGKPASTIEAYLCAENPSDGKVICSTDHFVKTRMTGKGEPSFTKANASQLLQIGGVDLFNATYENYFWYWGTGGRPHAQVWFIDSSCL